MIERAFRNQVIILLWALFKKAYNIGPLDESQIKSINETTQKFLDSNN